MLACAVASHAGQVENFTSFHQHKLRTFLRRNDFMSMASKKQQGRKQEGSIINMHCSWAWRFEKLCEEGGAFWRNSATLKMLKLLNTGCSIKFELQEGGALTRHCSIIYACRKWHHKSSNHHENNGHNRNDKMRTTASDRKLAQRTVASLSQSDGHRKNKHVNLHDCLCKTSK